MGSNLDRIRDYIINVVANDYENFGLIVDEVSAWASKDGMAVSPEEIMQALTSLVSDGLVDSYQFSHSSGGYELCDLASSNLTDRWFYVSKTGKAHLNAQS
jgi:hypothetical protein